MLWFGEKQRIRLADQPNYDRITVLLPVLNEAKRIERALAGLVAQPQEVQEILIVDGGSTDDTQAIVARFRARDPRVRLLDASPVDRRWTGKVWGLSFGFDHANPACEWMLCVDADVSVSPRLARSLLAHAKKTGVSAFSVATRQHLSGKIENLIHPAMLMSSFFSVRQNRLDK